MALLNNTVINRVRLLKFACVIDTPPLPFPAQIQHLVLGKRDECIDFTRFDYLNRVPDTIARAVPKRQYEFLLGRLAVGVLLTEHGVPAEDCWIESLERRPLWPHGIIGSISHSRDLVAVSVCRGGYGINSVGIDIEVLDQDAEAIRALATCFTPVERALLEQIENGLIIGFSMKEALYKCVNPITGLFFDFLDVEITHLDAISRCISLVLHRDLGARFSSGATFRGSYQIFSDHVWTGVFWEALRDCGRQVESA